MCAINMTLLFLIGSNINCSTLLYPKVLKSPRKPNCYFWQTFCRPGTAQSLWAGLGRVGRHHIYFRAEEGQALGPVPWFPSHHAPEKNVPQFLSHNTPGSVKCNFESHHIPEKKGPQGPDPSLGHRAILATPGCLMPAVVPDSHALVTLETSPRSQPGQGFTTPRPPVHGEICPQAKSHANQGCPALLWLPRPRVSEVGPTEEIKGIFSPIPGSRTL